MFEGVLGFIFSQRKKKFSLSSFWTEPFCDHCLPAFPLLSTSRACCSNALLHCVGSLNPPHFPGPETEAPLWPLPPNGMFCCLCLSHICDGQTSGMHFHVILIEHGTFCFSALSRWLMRENKQVQWAVRVIFLPWKTSSSREHSSRGADGHRKGGGDAHLSSITPKLELPAAASWTGLVLPTTSLH